MEQVDGFIEGGIEHLVYSLKKLIYGLKQLGKQWFEKLDQRLQNLNLKQLNSDSCVYMRRTDDTFLILIICVDDLIVAADFVETFTKLKEALAKPMVTLLDKNVKLSKDMEPSTEEESQEMKGVPYQSLIGSLMYVSCSINKSRHCICSKCIKSVQPWSSENASSAAKRVIRSSNDFFKGNSQPHINFPQDWKRSSRFCCSAATCISCKLTVKRMWAYITICVYRWTQVISLVFLISV